MSRTRRIALLAAAAVAATGLTAVTPATAAHRGPRPDTTWIDAVKAHEKTWVQIRWTTGHKVCDARLTVKGDGVRIAYPENTGTYTSFHDEADLEPGRSDYTAFRVRADRNRNTLVPLAAVLSYNTCGRHPVEKARIFRLHLPVLRNYDYDH